ncbi:MAG: hypothetical protein HYX20_01640 [Candidatus Yanofskybacteria bacterium]|nr:hypothetical protein [Candidatus Yanofskybacteria bacterium]
MRRLGNVKIKWTPAFAYAIGLIATDGNLSPDGRHINLTSKDEEQILNFRSCLDLKNKVGRKGRGGTTIKKYFVLQFGDRNFYDFLLGIGLSPAKSKTLTNLSIPRIFFADFFRGCIDGDGSIGYYRHPESRHPQLRLRLCSASRDFLAWIKSEIGTILGIKTGWIENKRSGVFVLIYAKADSLVLLKFLYKNIKTGQQLNRKYEIAKKFLGRVAELV